MAFFAQRRVLVTGGASFIGSHLTRALLASGARVTVADDFSSGLRGNLREVIDDIRLLERDLRESDSASAACHGAEIVFHLAAAHGGRGFIDSHPAACGENMLLDQQVFRASRLAGVAKVVFASSACVYPGRLQADARAHRALREEFVGPPFEPDGLYGMAKLTGELMLRALYREHGMPAAICRYFTAYGPRCGESHAIIAMIARAFARVDPFEIWGTGEQIRTWIYIDDLVRMTLLAAERIDDAEAVNVATDEEHTVREAAEMVLRATGHRAAIVPLANMPTGPLYRTASVTRTRELLGYRPEVDLAAGIGRTVDWYFATKDRATVSQTLDHLLVERLRPVPARADSAM
jgi:nucleoside-diphosphate-sugar epimerase